MEDLIKAFTIFLKYNNDKYPTHCEHDCLYVNINPKDVSNEDKIELEKLGFISLNDEEGSEDNDEDMFISYRFGSC